MCIRDSLKDTSVPRVVLHPQTAARTVGNGAQQSLFRVLEADAVSYTHLDVYKRQGTGTGLVSICLAGGIGLMTPVGRNIDVYKRQTFI